MKKKEFEDKMRSFEVFHGLKAYPNCWTILRLDGRSFSRLTEARFEKPFDTKFYELMLQTTERVLDETRGIYAYTESDEISILFPKDYSFFDREVEKLVSISASIASVNFSLAFGEPAIFDSRLLTIPQDADVADYFSWRQKDSARNCLNGWAYWLLRKEGKSSHAATKIIDKQGNEFKNELLFQRGINFNNLPLWQRRGVDVCYETYEKTGFNPKTGQSVQAIRKRKKINSELPMKDEYHKYIIELLKANTPE